MARYWFLLKRWVALLGLTATAAAVIFTVQTAALQKTLAALLVIDEAAIVRWASAIWAAAFPTLSTGGLFTVAKLDNRIFFVSIVLITDFTDNLFQKIFQRDQTRSSTILIQNNGK